MTTLLRAVLSKMPKEVSLQTAFFPRVGENLLETGEVLVLPTQEELLHAHGESSEVIRPAEAPVSMPDSPWPQNEITVGFKMGEGLNHPVSVTVQLPGGGIGVEGEPAASFPAGGEEVSEKLLLIRVVTMYNLLWAAQEFHLVSGIERRRGGEVALQFEVGEQGIDNERPNIVSASEVVVGDIKGISPLKDLIEDPSDGFG